MTSLLRWRPPSTRRAGTRGERGSSAVEFLILFPVFVLFLELVVLGGRVAVTHADVRSAAREAARQASLASGPSAAADLVAPTVEASLRDKGFACQSPVATLSPGTNFVAGGSVEVEVACTVELSDLGLLNAPGSIRVEATAAEPIERYRAVEP